MSAGGCSVVSERKKGGSGALGESNIRDFPSRAADHRTLGCVRAQEPPAHLIVDSDAKQFPGWKVQYNDLE